MVIDIDSGEADGSQSRRRGTRLDSRKTMASFRSVRVSGWFDVRASHAVRHRKAFQITHKCSHGMILTHILRTYGLGGMQPAVKGVALLFANVRSVHGTSPLES